MGRGRVDHAAVPDNQEVLGVQYEDAGIKEDESPVPTVAHGYRPGARVARKRDEVDGTAPGCSKKGALGKGTPKSGSKLKT